MDNAWEGNGRWTCHVVRCVLGSADGAARVEYGGWKVGCPCEAGALGHELVAPVSTGPMTHTVSSHSGSHPPRQHSHSG